MLIFYEYNKNIMDVRQILFTERYRVQKNYILLETDVLYHLYLLSSCPSFPQNENHEKSFPSPESNIKHYSKNQHPILNFLEPGSDVISSMYSKFYID